MGDDVASACASSMGEVGGDIILSKSSSSFAGFLIHGWSFLGDAAASAGASSNATSSARTSSLSSSGSDEFLIHELSFLVGELGLISPPQGRLQISSMTTLKHTLSGIASSTSVSVEVGNSWFSLSASYSASSTSFASLFFSCSVTCTSSCSTFSGRSFSVFSSSLFPLSPSCICTSSTCTCCTSATPARSLVNNLSFAITISNGLPLCLIKWTISAHSNGPITFSRRSTPPTSRIISPASKWPLSGPFRGGSSSPNGLKGVTCKM
mmetsp:Transcript_22392/g.48559  ORF Transcript_22392/g.48559 Transcript_22392/m.48559 type:complete len:266 (-) Transcript_22392:341-1138(-)